MRTIQIRRWDEFVDLIRPGGDFESWAFRGHASADWQIWSTLSRRLQRSGVHADCWPLQEERIVRIFKRKAHLFLSQVPEDADTFQWLALMQHHGAPTRLIDFTWSPFVAAFFALDEASGPRAAVWAVHPGHVWAANERRGSRQRVRSLREAGGYEHYVREPAGLAYQGEPAVMNKRLTAQNGTFIVPLCLDRPLEAILAGYRGGDDLVVKFEIDTAHVRSAAMRAFYAMNITQASLFPDLDGLARSMAYELEYHWAIDPMTGALKPGFGDDPYFRSLSSKINDSRDRVAKKARRRN